MPHAVRLLNLTADQCHERARLVRSFAKGVTSCLLRQDLLDIAAEYERFAEDRSSGDVERQIGEGSTTTLCSPTINNHFGDQC